MRRRGMTIFVASLILFVIAGGVTLLVVIRELRRVSREPTIPPAPLRDRAEGSP